MSRHDGPPWMLAQRLIPRIDSDKWPDLPVCGSRQEIVNKVRDNQVLVITGETGSGKTTQIPQFLATMPMLERGIIGCTQPRRVACISVARRVAEEVGTEVGEAVGYAIRFEDETSSRTGIKYMTDGVLLRECLTDRRLSKYSCVVLDEAHERSLNTDILFGLMKEVCSARPNFRLLVTSATLDTEKMSRYFFNAPIMAVPGRCFPVEIQYHTGTWGERGYLTPMLELVERLHVREPPNRHILLFLTGQDEIDRACKGAHERIMKLVEAGLPVPGLQVCPLHASLPPDYYGRVFDDVPEDTRKLIVSTNIAETSVTVAGVYFVIDCGFVKQKVFNADSGMESLDVVNISQMAASQRAGRAGRTGPGVCIRLYGQERFEEEFEKSTLPEILRSNLSNTVLMLKGMGITDVVNFDFLDPPPEETLRQAHRTLFLLRALDKYGKISSLGQDMIRFPLEPSLARMLLHSVDLHCSEEILVVIALITSESSIFFRPAHEDERKIADLKRAQFMDPEGDASGSLTAYYGWASAGFTKQYCTENFLNLRALKRAKDVVQQLQGIMKRMQLPIVKAKLRSDVGKAIAMALYAHAARRGLKDAYVLIDDGRMVTLSPSSLLCAQGEDEWPDIIVGYELFWAGGGQLRFVCAAELSWIRELLPNLVDIDMNRLCGPKRKRARPVTNDDSAGGADGSGGAGGGGGAAVPVMDKAAKIAAAKARALERKKLREG